MLTLRRRLSFYGRQAEQRQDWLAQLLAGQQGKARKLEHVAAANDALPGDPRPLHLDE